MSNHWLVGFAIVLIITACYWSAATVSGLAYDREKKRCRIYVMMK